MNCFGLVLPSTTGAPTLMVGHYDVDTGKIDLEWTAVAGADSYTVKRYSDEAGDAVTTYSVTTNTLSDPDVSRSRNYYYRVAAVINETTGEWYEPPVLVSTTDIDLPTTLNPDNPFRVTF